jgi:diguanylate cyclase (GGDEF)-like protein
MAGNIDINELINNSEKDDKNAELSKELLMYFTLFENVNGGGHCCTISDNPVFLEISDGMFRLFNMERDEFIAATENSPKMMIYEPDRKWAHETIHTQLVVGDKSEVTYRIVDGFGAIKWVHDVGHRLKRPDGTEVIFSTLTDITEQVDASERLSNTSFELETLMTNIPAGICVFEYENGRMKISYANEEYFVLNGFTSEYFYMLGDTDISRFISEKDYPLLQQKLEDALSTSEPFDFEYKVVRPDEMDVWVSLKAKVFKYHDDNPVFYSIIWDVSKRKQVENELYLQSERYKAIEENMDEIPFDYVIPTDTLILSRRAMAREDIGSRVYNFLSLIEENNYIHPDSRENFIRFIAECKKKKSSGTFEFQAMFRADMQYHWYEIHYTNVLDSNGVPVRIVGRVNDFDEEKKAQEELEKRLMCDEMTGLYNKTACEKIIAEKIKKAATTSALIVIDIDNFKLINDTFGHTFGDTVIQNFAQSIKAAVWDDVTVGRIGGDEFMLYIPDSTQDNAVEIAKHICELVKNSYVGEQLHLPDNVGCSIGIAYAPDDGSDYHSVFDKADLAMYHSKAMGKNRYTEYDKSIEASTKKLIPRQEERHEQFSRSHAKIYDTDFITFAFSLLSHSRDINSSINILLERIGMNYGVDFVAVLEDVADDGYMHHTNLWASDKGIMAEETLPPVNTKNTRFIPPKSTSPNLFVINDTLDMETDKDVGEFLKQTYNCFAMAATRFPENNNIDGCVIITDCTNTRSWTELELGTFAELARIMSVFVSLRRERIRSLERIEELSTIDALTGLYNQTTFIAQAEPFIKEHFSKKKYVALIYTDINGFSYVNENFGYEAGDKMLCDFADAISTDTEHPKINGRVYSDFFLTISAADTEEEIINAVENINSFFIEQQKVIYPASNLNLSTGIYFVREIPKHSISALIENANLARKEAKLTGDSFYIYDDQLTKKRAREQRAANDLHNAIETGELRLFLQPKFSIQNRVAVGAEALCRWILPDGTLRYPSEFIPILEQIGYIVELDYFIFSQTLKYIRKWLDEDKIVHPISVNFARQHLKTDDFVKRVYALTQEYRVPPEYIEIEITESESVNDSEHFLSVMEQFHSMGFRIDIDDFGTGYSSLSMLLDAPFDIVKIDKRFITNVDYTPKYLSYLRTLIKLIRTSGKDIIFEGVETEQQAYYLSQCGCDIAQGYLFSRAVCVEEFERKYVK